MGNMAKIQSENANEEKDLPFSTKKYQESVVVHASKRSEEPAL